MVRLNRWKAAFVVEIIRSKTRAVANKKRIKARMDSPGTSWNK